MAGFWKSSAVDTSSGDTTFTTADRWIITDDSFLPGDPTNSHFLFGPGTPSVTPSSVSQTVFEAAGTEGVLANYPLTVPANSTLSLLFFNQLNSLAADAQAGVANFDVLLTPSDENVSGLTLAELNTVANWEIVPEPSSLLLAGMATVGLFAVARRRRIRKTPMSQ